MDTPCKRCKIGGAEPAHAVFAGADGMSGSEESEYEYNEDDEDDDDTNCNQSTINRSATEISRIIDLCSNERASNMDGHLKEVMSDHRDHDNEDVFHDDGDHADDSEQEESDAESYIYVDEDEQDNNSNANNDGDAECNALVDQSEAQQSSIHTGSSTGGHGNLPCDGGAASAFGASSSWPVAVKTHGDDDHDDYKPDTTKDSSVFKAERALNMAQNLAFRIQAIHDEVVGGSGVKDKYQDKGKGVASNTNNASHDAGWNRTLGGGNHSQQTPIPRSVHISRTTHALAPPPPVDLATLGIQPFKKLDLIVLAQRLIHCRDEFRRQNRPFLIDIGYHYTVGHNLDKIVDHGLLTKCDRDTEGICNRFNGAAYGNGVYTCDNFVGTTSYGDIGLVVARLQGTPEYDHPTDAAANTVIVPKNAYTVLKTSAQCCPLVQYPTSMLRRSTQVTTLLHRYRWKLQCLLDEVFHQVPSPAIEPLMSKKAGFECPGIPRRFFMALDALAYDAPKRLNDYILPDIFREVTDMSSLDEASRTCSMCRRPTANAPSVSMRCCSEVCHKKCISSWFDGHLHCHKCNKAVPTTIGSMPNGTMIVHPDDARPQKGTEPSCRSVRIEYSIERGHQKSYHPHPGKSWIGVAKSAALPYVTEEDKMRLGRLKYAFLNGHVLILKANAFKHVTIAWGSIPHFVSGVGRNERDLARIDAALDNLCIPNFVMEA